MPELDQDPAIPPMDDAYEAPVVDDLEAPDGPAVTAAAKSPV